MLAVSSLHPCWRDQLDLTEIVHTDAASLLDKRIAALESVQSVAAVTVSSTNVALN